MACTGVLSEKMVYLIRLFSLMTSCLDFDSMVFNFIADMDNLRKIGLRDCSHIADADVHQSCIFILSIQ